MPERMSLSLDLQLKKLDICKSNTAETLLVHKVWVTAIVIVSFSSHLTNKRNRSFCFNIFGDSKVKRSLKMENHSFSIFSIHLLIALSNLINPFTAQYHIIAQHMKIPIQKGIAQIPMLSLKEGESDGFLISIQTYNSQIVIIERITPSTKPHF